VTTKKEENKIHSKRSHFKRDSKRIKGRRTEGGERRKEKDSKRRGDIISE